MPNIEFLGDKTIEYKGKEESLLKTSLGHGIAHVNACGGKGRCSTCRVRVIEGAGNLSPMKDVEMAYFADRGLPADVRMACQAKASGPVKVRRLVFDDIDVSMIAQSSSRLPLKEMNLAILFSDIRDFTPLSERHLPYDIVHMLNRYFRCAGQAVFGHAGVIDKYIGDAIMAVFGLDGRSPAESCRDALLAAQDLVGGMEQENDYIERHFGERIRCGVGVHFGTVVVGEIGHPDFTQYTAIGDAVNVASRVESMTKSASTSILTSCAVMKHVPELIQLDSKLETILKGKTGTFNLFKVASK